MRTTAYHCDRCSAPIREDRTWFRVETGRLRRLARESVDLCEACASAFEAWLGVKPEGTPAEAVADSPF